MAFEALQGLIRPYKASFVINALNGIMRLHKTLQMSLFLYGVLEIEFVAITVRNLTVVG